MAFIESNGDIFPGVEEYNDEVEEECMGGKLSLDESGRCDTDLDNSDSDDSADELVRDLRKNFDDRQEAAIFY